MNVMNFTVNENLQYIIARSCTCYVQVYMEISCPDGGDGGRKNVFPATHREIHPTNILSVVGNLTPWSDHNQSPRNMYQCQVLS